MVSSAFSEMYIQMTFADIPGATEQSMLDLLLPCVKNMEYKALLVMTTMDQSRIHVLFRFHKPQRKEYVAGRLFRNVYSKLVDLPPGKRATDYITIGHKMKESDYMDIAEVAFDDQWGPALAETLEDLKKGLLELEKWLEPHLDRMNKMKKRIAELAHQETIQ